MNYRYVRVGKTKSYGFYQNASIDLEVELEGNQPEPLSLIVKQLDEEVEKLLDQIIHSQHISEIEASIKQLEERRNELENEIDKLSDNKKELLSRLASIAVLIKDLEAQNNEGNE